MPHPLVADWIAYHGERAKPSDPRFRAWEELNDLIRTDPEAGGLVILEMIEATPDDLTLANVAAGPPEPGCRRTQASVDRYIRKGFDGIQR
jgi:hypothetical protein